MSKIPIDKLVLTFLSDPTNTNEQTRHGHGGINIMYVNYYTNYADL
jgi:hypothetical protein